MAGETTDLRVTGTTETSISLAWTVPAHTTNPYYELGYSTRHPVGQETYSQISFVAGLPEPGTPGETEVMAVSGLVPGYTYHFGLWTTDDDSASGLSNLVSAHIVDPIHRWLTSGQARLAALWNAKHAYIPLVTGSVETPYTLTPDPGLRICINSISVQVSHTCKVYAESPGVDRCLVQGRTVGGGLSRYWQGWPWFIGNRDQPVTFRLYSGTPTWVDISLGYFEA